MKDRAQLARDSKATLIHEWDVGDNRYRLISRGKFSAGYEDEYFVERLSSDALGEPKWEPHASWKPDDDRTSTILIAAIKSLLNMKKPEGFAWKGPA